MLLLSGVLSVGTKNMVWRVALGLLVPLMSIEYPLISNVPDFWELNTLNIVKL